MRLPQTGSEPRIGQRHALPRLSNVEALECTGKLFQQCLFRQARELDCLLAALTRLGGKVAADCVCCCVLLVGRRWRGLSMHREAPLSWTAHATLTRTKVLYMDQFSAAHCHRFSQVTELPLLPHLPIGIINGSQQVGKARRVFDRPGAFQP